MFYRSKNCFLLLFLVLICIVPGAPAHADQVDHHQHAISFSSHRTGVPGLNQNASYFSGYGLGYEYRFSMHSVGWFDYYAKLNINSYHQAYYQNALSGGGAYAIGYASSFGLETFLSLGLGYQRSFDEAALYESNKQGEYRQVRDYGHGSLIIPLAVELGYRLPGHLPINAIFVQYCLDIETPFAPANKLPIMGHEYLTMGLRF